MDELEYVELELEKNYVNNSDFHTIGQGRYRTHDEQVQGQPRCMKAIG